MNLKRFFLALILVTGMMLVYVHQRVVLITSGYEVESLRRLKDDLLDQHQVLNYNVLTLRSPVILDKRLAQSNVELTAPKVVQVLISPRTLRVPGERKGFQPEPTWLRQTMKLAVRWLENSRPAVAEPVREE